ncbi:MAG: DUF456 domain-containing protein [Sedimentisphaerales bacterium]|nr:DUF456 domain-containing protein [Sedimentisphaerales bacterium]
MLYLWLIGLILLNTVWLSLVLLGLPGNWLIVISTCLFAWWRWNEGPFSIYILVAIVVLAGLGELVEFSAGLIGAKKSGASWFGSIAAIFGAVIGAVFGTFMIAIPFLGTILGACIGAGVGVWGLEVARGKEMEKSVRYGLGAGLGELFGITSKLILGFVIWLTVTIAAFWP